MRSVALGAALAAACSIVASLSAAEPIGWRGNNTGLWPEAKSPITWSRTRLGALQGARAQAHKPAGAEAGDAPLLEKGLPREWLIAGPFSVSDSDKDIDRDLLGGEAAIQPAEGGAAGERRWQLLRAPWDDPDVFGTAEMPYVKLADPKLFGFANNQVAYAATYLHSPRGGKARILVDHSTGLKVWVNDKQVYRETQRQMNLGFYTGISRKELAHAADRLPHFEIELKPGWNRLLLKLTTAPREGFREQSFLLRVVSAKDVAYEQKNIAWMTELPGRSTSTPIQVGSKLFLMSEPDELLCVDATTGKLLWSRAINHYEALTADEKKRQPDYAAKIDPLVAALQKETERDRRLSLRSEIKKGLTAIDAARFEVPANDHFEAHFGIVGFTMPTPASDGKSVYAWCNTGVGACFDLEGNRKWITVVPAKHLAYGSSPAVTEGVVAVFLEHLFGLDAKTGEILWEQSKVHKNVAAVQAAKFGGESVFVTQQADVIRPKDGELLFRPRGETSGDNGWAPPVALGNLLYRTSYGVTSLTVFDFANAPQENWKPKELLQLHTPPEVSRKPDGGWIDRWTAGSALIHNGLAYQTDIYGYLYVFDLEAKKLAYWRRLDHQGLTHYNAVAFAASPSLVGKHVMLFDNQGTCFVLEPGREFKLVATNRIETELDRAWPIPAQETLNYAPPICAGERMYLRGERYLYCISP